MIASCLALLLLFQSLGVSQPVPAAESGLSTEAAPGARDGTRRYNVTFRTRSFELAELRSAIAEQQSAVIVERIIKDLELRARVDQEPFRRAVEAMGGSVVLQFWLINAATIEIAPAQLGAVAALPNVWQVRPDLIAQPLGTVAVPRIRVSTDANHHNADLEQAAGNKATGIGVAILDSGQNENLHGSFLPHRMYYRNGDRNNHTATGVDGSRLVANVLMGSQPPDNGEAHGIGVAGIAAGEIWSTAGADRGHASDADIAGYSMCVFLPGCATYLSVEASSWQRVANDKVRFNIAAANMSYASAPDPLDVSQQALDACVLTADVVACTAAGNSGPGASSTTSSSPSINGLAVAATDAGKAIAQFSSRGPFSSDLTRFFPDIAANGVNTVMPQTGSESSDFIASGTSMASPQVCGAAALVKSARPTLNAREIKALLLHTTESITTQNPGLDRNAYGLGYLRDDYACRVARGPASVLSDTLDPQTTLRNYVLPVVQGRRYAATLVWHRQSSSSTQWSDLNLRVLNGTSVLGQSNSPRNLYEKVSFQSPVTGTVTVEVSSASLETAQVPFSLALGDPTGSDLVAGTYTYFGQGCLGTAQPYACLTLPANVATTFGNHSLNAPMSSAPARFHQVFLGTQLPTSYPITHLGFRQDDQSAGYAGATVDLEINLAKTSRTPNTISIQFASNLDRGAPLNVLPRTQLVLPNMPATLPSDPSQFLVEIPLAIPFTWSQTPGDNLLLEIRQYGNNRSGPFTYPLDATTLGSTSSITGYPATATTGQFSLNIGLVVCFKGPSGNPGMVPLLAAPNTPRTNNTFNLQLSQAASNTVALLFLGASNTSWRGIPLPLDLTPAGAPGCSLLASGSVVLSLATDGFGNGLLGIPVPNDVTFVNLTFYNQFLVYDPQANPLGFALTRGGRGLIGNM